MKGRDPPEADLHQRPKDRPSRVKREIRARARAPNASCRRCQENALRRERPGRRLSATLGSPACRPDTEAQRAPAKLSACCRANQRLDGYLKIIVAPYMLAAFVTPKTGMKRPPLARSPQHRTPAANQRVHTACRRLPSASIPTALCGTRRPIQSGQPTQSDELPVNTGKSDRASRYQQAGL